MERLPFYVDLRNRLVSLKNSLIKPKRALLLRLFFFIADAIIFNENIN